MKRMLMTVCSRAVRFAVFGIVLGGIGFVVGHSSAEAQTRGKKTIPAEEAAKGQRSIAAIVNDDIISVRDLEMRSKLALLSSRIADTPDNRRRVQPLVLRKLVDEHLQWQEAKRRSIAVTESEIAQGISIIEKRSGMPSGGLAAELKRGGVDIKTIHDQIRSDIAWMKLLSTQVAPRVRVGAAEIDRRFAAISGSEDRMEFQLAEIFVSVDDSKDLAVARRGAQELLVMLRKGTPFQAVAQQFSQSVSASSGGDLGWVREEAMKPELAAVAKKLQPGRVSELIQVENGYYIIMLRDRRGGPKASAPSEPPQPQIRRRALPPDPAKVTVTLAQLVFPFPVDATDAEKKAMEAQAARARASLKSCADIDRIAQELGLPQSGVMGSMKVSDLSAPIQPLILSLKAGRSSSPLNRGDAAVILMVCERQDPPVRYVEEEILAPKVETPPPPTRDAVARGLEDEKMEMESRRMLRDLRRSAYLDIRM